MHFQNVSLFSSDVRKLYRSSLVTSQLPSFILLSHLSRSKLSHISSYPPLSAAPFYKLYIYSLYIIVYPLSCTDGQPAVSAAACTSLTDLLPPSEARRTGVARGGGEWVLGGGGGHLGLNWYTLPNRCVKRSKSGVECQNLGVVRPFRGEKIKGGRGGGGQLQFNSIRGAVT